MPASQTQPQQRHTCPQCHQQTLMRGRYDLPDGDSEPWAHCENPTCNYEY